MRTEIITSVHNPKIKDLLALQEKSAKRREAGLFVVEGQREISHCIRARFTIEALFFCPAVAGEARLPKVEDARLYEVSAAVYDRIAYRGGTEGLIAVVRSKNLGLDDLNLGSNPLIIVLESVEKPGNLGAVLRSADAAGADAVIICNPLTDLYNPNLIRASIGAVFTTQVVAASSAETIAWLKAKGISILTAQLQDSELYYDTDMRGGTAIVMGTEDVGLSGEWRAAADRHIRIPMNGQLDSLNVSVSAAVLLFEAVRQRNG